MRTTIVWNIDLTALVKKRIAIETLDGANLTGVLSRVVFRPMTIDGHAVETPVAIVLDGDNEIPFGGLLAIKRIVAK